MEVIDQKIIIFGGTGSLGKALIRRLASKNELILFSRDEAKHWTIKNQLLEKHNVKFVVGDIRDLKRIEETMLKHNPTLVIIAAALKQVDTCEVSPYESVQTNILGIKNIIDSILSNLSNLPALETVLMVSTDKACAPANVYGMCKSIAERLITSSSIGLVKPKFIGVRYGNVLESRGSIIPLFRYQAESQNSFTVTHPEMTRFIMTLDQSIDLIEKTINGANSGEIWLPKLKSMKIYDLAEIFSNKFSKPIEMIGVRPGEKLHEDLISDSESFRVIDEGETLRMLPSHITLKKMNKLFHYSSNQDVLSRNELEHYLNQIKIFDQSIDQFEGKEIEEIRTRD